MKSSVRVSVSMARAAPTVSATRKTSSAVLFTRSMNVARRSARMPSLQINPVAPPRSIVTALVPMSITSCLCTPGITSPPVKNTLTCDAALTISACPASTLTNTRPNSAATPKNITTQPPMMATSVRSDAKSGMQWRSWQPEPQLDQPHVPLGLPTRRPQTPRSRAFSSLGFEPTDGP